ncbi:MAG: DUF481 domain-containing protein [Candidatus Omnitrophota bacterium]
MLINVGRVAVQRTGLWMLFFFCWTYQVNADCIYFKNGDRVTGKVLEQNQELFKVKTELFGEVVLSRDKIDHVDQSEGSLPVVVKPGAAKILENSLALSYAVTKGNTYSRNAAVSLNTMYKNGRNVWATESLWQYGSDNRKMTTQKLFSKAHSDYFLGETSKWFWTRAVELSHDRFNNIDVRLIPSTGIGYRFWDIKDSKALVDTALGYEYVDYRDGSKSEGALVIVPHVFLSRKLFWKALFAQDLSFYPSLEGSAYRLRSVSSLMYPVNDVLSWKLSLTDDFNSRPVGNAKKNDSTLMSSLNYAF